MTPPGFAWAFFNANKLRKYRIKPEFLSEWGEDATEETVITDDDLEMIARGWETTKEELTDQLIEEE